MINIKISVPTYKSNSWGQFDKQGEVEINSDVDSLSGGYFLLKAQIDELLTQVNAENQMVLDLQKLDSEVDRRKNTLRNLNQKIDVAKAQFQRLEKFLRRLGIDPTSYHLDINKVVLDATIDQLDETFVVEAEVDPIPFDSEGISHEF